MATKTPPTNTWSRCRSNLSLMGGAVEPGPGQSLTGGTYYWPITHDAIVKILCIHPNFIYWFVQNNPWVMLLLLLLLMLYYRALFDHVSDVSASSQNRKWFICNYQDRSRCITILLTFLLCEKQIKLMFFSQQTGTTFSFSIIQTDGFHWIIGVLMCSFSSQ